MCNNQLKEIEERLIEIEKEIENTNQKAKVSDLLMERESLIDIMKGN